jgi:aflatoxin B1 aldehyde reductase
LTLPGNIAFAPELAMPLVAQNPTDRIILGLMTFGPIKPAGARITDIGEYNKILDAFQSRGYNEVDTARLYVDGEQEAFTKEARWKERGLSLATKIKYPSSHGANTPDEVFMSANTSLEALGSDCVDVSMPSAIGLTFGLGEHN